MSETLTTKDALLERMVAATNTLATDVPAKFDEYLPLAGGTITGNLEVNGSLTRGGNTIESVIGKSSNYIRFDSGLQLCWGYTTATSSGTEVTFGGAFKDNNYVVIEQGTGASVGAGHGTKTTTSVIIITSSASTAASVEWVAIGWWK